MNQQINDIITKLSGTIEHFCVYENGFNGVLVNQIKESFNNIFPVFGIVDQNLELFKKIFDEKELLHVTNNTIIFPAFISKSITANLYKRTKNDLILSAVIYEQKTYLCVAITGVYYYEAEFDLIEGTNQDQIYHAYVKIIDFMAELMASL